MKRIAIVLVVVFLLILAFLFLTRSPNTDPHYVPVQTQPAGPFAYTYYDSAVKVPIRDGKFWLWAMPSATNTPRHMFQYLYDIDQRKVVGELLDAAPVFANQDGTKLLCEGFGSPHDTLKQRLGTLLSRLTAGKISLFSTNWTENFWILDVRSNSAVRIGELSQLPGSGSWWTPAPGFRYGYNRPSASAWGREFFLCDLEENSLQKISFAGELQGWWDDHNLVAKDSAGNYALFDVVGRKSTPLFTKADISQFLHDQGITSYAPDYATICNWNGAQYDFYFTANRQNGLDTNITFLIKVNHDVPRFQLVSHSFKLHWLGYLDASGTHYFYSGDSGSPGNGGNGGVYLRDLSNNRERILVPPNNRGQYALARIYSNTVIYWRDRVLWRLDLSSTNSFRLFPPLPN